MIALWFLLPRRFWAAQYRQQRAVNAAQQHQIEQLRADLRAAQAATWAARQERDEAIECNGHLFDTVCQLFQERTQRNLAALADHALPWNAGDYEARDRARSGQGGM